jgi:MYXO-CTERM domain-containing protein
MHAAAPKSAPDAHVVSRDAKTGLPSFVFGVQSDAFRPSSAVVEEAAREHLVRHAARWGLGAEALATAVPVRTHDIGRGGVMVAFRHVIDGVEVFQHDVKVLMDRDGRLLAIGGSPREDAFLSSRIGSFKGPDAAAVAVALGDLYSVSIAPGELVLGDDLPGGYRSFVLGAALAQKIGVDLNAPVRVKKVYFPLPDRLVPAYFLEVSARGAGERHSDAFAYVVAAGDGQILFRNDLTHQAKFKYRLWADATGDFRPKDGPMADYAPYPGKMPLGTFPDTIASNVIEIDGFNKLHDPWLPDGAEQTSGNNVDAYTDDDKPDGFSKNDVRAHISSAGTFDIPIDLTKGPQDTLDQRMGAVTSLFYVTNWMHDWWYDSGFDEKGKNAQKDNYGRGGVAGDALQAQAQNGAPDERNNSDMAVFDDGMSPVMQMFVWDGKGEASVTLGTDAPMTNVGEADYSPVSFDVDGDVVLVDDGAAPNADLCDPIKNDVTGKIALIERGKCTFDVKAKAALAAGAIGAILYDNVVAGSGPTISANKPAGSIPIPILSITQAAGEALKTSLAAGPVKAHLHRKGAPDIDGTLDNTIVAHEWGHYLHLRNVACNSSLCSAQAEGWADFNALMMVVRAGDDPDAIYPLAQWATKAFPQDPAYFGVRRYPYSSNMMVNPLTFKHITSGTALPAGIPVQTSTAKNDNAEAHAAGEVWAAMMFEAYVGMLKAHPYEEAHRKMGDYVVLGMATAPTDPTYLEQRDSVLAAAAASSLSDLKVLADGFAKRGAGTCAVSPERDSQDFAGVVESFTAQGDMQIVDLTLDDSTTSCDKDGHLDVGEKGKLTLSVKNAGPVPVTGASATVTTTLAGLTFPSGAKITIPTVAPYASVKATVDVALAGPIAGVGKADLTLKLDGAPSCLKVDTVSASPLVNVDEVETGLTTDDVESTKTVWTTAGKQAAMVWSRAEIGPGNHAWVGADFPSVSDNQLVSPPLVVGTDNLVLTFKHAHAFEASMGFNFDGAVIEISTDAGKTWQDVSTLGDPGYEGTIVASAMGQASTNPLKGRKGYVGRNASYPALDPVSVDLGNSLAGMTVQVRFRIGTDDGAGAAGWQVDDIGFTGITNAPFSGLAADKGACGTPTGTGGAGGMTGTGGTTGAGATTGTGGASTGKGGAAGVGGGTAGAGSSVQGKAGTGGTTSAPNNAATPEVDGGGCACSTPATTSTPPWSLAALVGLVAAFRRRKRSLARGAPAAALVPSLHGRGRAPFVFPASQPAER